MHGRPLRLVLPASRGLARLLCAPRAAGGARRRPLRPTPARSAAPRQEAAADPELPRRCHAFAPDQADCVDEGGCAFADAPPGAAAAFACSSGWATPAAEPGAPAAASPAATVPATVHWVWPGGPGEAFPYWALLHACAVADVLRPGAFLLHHVAGAPPTGAWWDAAAPLFTALSARPAVARVYGRAVGHPAHASDVMRLRALLAHGGVYLDTDVLARPHVEGEAGRAARRAACALAQARSHTRALSLADASTPSLALADAAPNRTTLCVGG